MVQEVRNKEKVTPLSDRKKEIIIFVVDGDVASVKLAAAHWTNYMTLTKQNGEWKILSIVKRNQE
jgi:putative lumazine-binding protein